MSIHDYTLEELREALRLKEEERLVELGKKCHGVFYLTKDIVHVHRLLHSEVGEGFMDEEFFTKRLLRNTTHFMKYEKFTLDHSADSGLHIFSVVFGDMSYFESVGNVDDIAFVLENSNFYDSIKD